MISPERREWLYQEFVLVIENECDWYYQVNGKTFGQFRRATGNFIYTIRTKFHEGEILSSEEFAYILTTLWMNRDGDLDLDACLEDPGPLKEAIEALVKEIRKNQALFENTAPTTQPPSNPYPIYQEITMPTINTNPNVAIEIKTLVFGQDASLLTDEQLIDAIKRIEGDIAKLKEVKTPSKKIAASIKELNDQLEAVVELLDSRL